MSNHKKQAAAVFLHGFQGSPQQFTFLFPVARECGFEVCPLLLPGHGGDYRTFINNGRDAWEAYVRAELGRLRNEYEHLLLVGHSMGGLLGILAGLENPDGINGIFAIALPLHLRVSYAGIRNNWKYASGSGEEDAHIQTARKFCSVTGITLWNTPLMLPRLFDLVALSTKARRRLCDLKIPLAILHSQHDEWVSAHSLQTAERCLLNPPSILLLPESGHFFYTEADMQRSIDHFSIFARACLTQK